MFMEIGNVLYKKGVGQPKISQEDTERVQLRFERCSTTSGHLGASTDIDTQGAAPAPN